MVVKKQQIVWSVMDMTIDHFAVPKQKTMDFIVWVQTINVKNI